MPLPRRAFWYLRHGETDWNARGLSQGNVDIPLNPVGVAQAEQAAGLLRGCGLRAVVSSPLSRARVTAEIVAAPLGLTIAFDEGLREVSFGVQEGQPMGDWYDDWVAGHFTPEGAEPFAALRARATAALARALAHPEPVLVVAHGALFRAVRAEMGLPVNVRTPNAVPILCRPGAAPDEAWTLTAAA